MLRARRDHYVRLVNSGMNYTQAARTVGVSKRTGKAWRNGRTRSTGRDEKASVDCYRKGMEQLGNVDARYLCQEERLRIADLHRLGHGVRAIARAIGRPPSTVSREIRRNTNPGSGLYEPYRAQQQAAGRLKRPKPHRVLADPRLGAAVSYGLSQHWSPEQTSRRLVMAYPDDETMRASHETIYQAIYVQAKGGLKLELKQALRQGRAARKPQGAVDGRTKRFRDPMAMIAERPPEADDRAIPGHWEGDLITGAHNKSAIGTLVERTTRFIVLLYLPEGHDAGQVQDAIIRKMSGLPGPLRRSLTWDQGSEMARHAGIRTALDLDVYFCDPHSPWQRGTNENTNGLLRQYFPKGIDLSVYPEDYLDAVARELNDRPRKTLDWMTPAEKITPLLQGIRYPEPDN